MHKKIIIIIALVFIISLLAGCFLSNQTPQTESVEAEPAQPQEPSSAAPSAKEVIIIAKEFNFTPAVINVKAGEKVKIIFRNEGTVMHNFFIGSLGVMSRTINSGETDTVEFTAPSVGVYNFYCSVPGHQSAGMQGRLMVEL